MRSLSLLSLLIFSSHLLAEDCADCSFTDKIPSIFLDPPETRIYHWSVTPEQVTKSPCHKELITLPEIDSYFQKQDKKIKSGTTIINGVSFEDEDETLLHLYSLLTTELDLFYDLSTHQTDVQKKFAINPDCKKVRCAVDKIFGKELGPKLLFMLNRYGFNGSEFAFKNTSRLEISEIDPILKALSDYPELTFPLEKNKRLTKFKRSFKLEKNSDGVVANAQINLFDLWPTLPPEHMISIVFHELAHYTARRFDLDNTKEWRNFSGWIGKDGEWKTTIPNTLLSKYAKANPDEDFAESVVAYRYRPEFFKTKAPEKYKYIKDTVFRGIEYLDEKSCAESNYLDIKLSDKVKKKLDTFNDSPEASSDETIKTVLQSCQNEVFDLFTSDHSMFDQCIEHAVLNKVALDEISSLNEITYPDFTKKIFSKKHHLNLPVEGNAVQTTRALAKNKYKEIMIQDMVRLDQDSTVYYLDNANKMTTPQFCEYLTRDSYQSCSGLDSFMSVELFAFTYRDQIKKTFQTICEKVFENSKEKKHMTKEEIEKNFPF